MARDIALEQKWRDRIEECRQSGLSIKIWCLQNEVKDSAYYYWVRRFKSMEQQEAGENKFAEVIIPPGSRSITKERQPMRSKISLSLGAYSIGIEDDFNPETLAELVKVLQKL